MQPAALLLSSSVVSLTSASGNFTGHYGGFIHQLPCFYAKDNEATSFFSTPDFMNFSGNFGMAFISCSFRCLVFLWSGRWHNPT